MSGWFRSDGRLVVLMNRASDLVLLNLLWIAFSLPVVTCGAATVALCRVALYRQRGIEEGLFQAFFDAFKRCFRSGTALGLLGLVAATVIALDARIVALHPDAFGLPGKFSVYLLATTELIVLTYAFPLLAFFNDGLWATLRNALLMSLRHFGYTLAMLTNMALPIVLCVIFTRATRLPLYLLFVVGTTAVARLNARFLLKVFERYIPDEQRRSYEEKEL